MNNKGQRALIVGILLLIILVIVVSSSAYTIPAGSRGVLLTFGKPDVIAQSEGLHFKAPFFQNVIKMSVQTESYEVAKASAASSDLQTVTTDVTVNYYINPESVPDIYTKVGVNYKDKVIAPAVQEVIKSVTAKYTAEQLITQRPQVKDDIDNALTSRLKTWNINVQAVSITDFQFSAIFNDAIEAKVTQEQASLTAQNKLAQIQFEAQQRVAQAEGEATAIKIQGAAIQSLGGKDYIQLQAIQKWNGQLPLVTGGSSLPFINIPTTNTTQ